MKTAAQVVEFQKNNSFEDIVIQFIDQVASEEVQSQFLDTSYSSIWTFKDGSRLYLRDELFFPMNDK